jgi:hypothetical protein
MRLAKLCMILVVLLVSPRALLAAGGTCPSGANYLSLSNPTGPKVTLSSFGVTSCYYIAANGSDSNNGTSESTPWLHSPGMPNCSANCLSLQSSHPAAGEGFIFRGGDTWHFGNSSASPYTGGVWEWFMWGGTISNYIYIGVDPNWYSGSSWARPILNADNPTSTSSVASCSYQVAANPIDNQGPSNYIVDLDHADYIIFDNFELTGLCWTSATQNAGGTYLTFSGSSAGVGNVAYIQNNYVHGWTKTAAAAQSGAEGITDYSQNAGETLRFNVIDGSDSDPLTLESWGQGSSGYDLEYNVSVYGNITNVFNSCHIQHDNLFEKGQQLTDNSSHSDIDFCFGEYSGGSSNPNLFYNNIYRNIGTSGAGYAGYILVLDTPSGQTDYAFNNVFHDNYASQGQGLCDNAVSSQCGPLVLFNNTIEGYLPSVSGVFNNTDIKWSTPITSVNNHWISNSGTTLSAVFTDSALVTESSTLYQTLSTANGQGYTSPNDFSPTSASGGTVTYSGTNETTGYCADSVLHNAAAEAACVQGITGVSYNSTNHTVVYPAFPAVSRPATGAWQVGAYQNGGSSAQVSPPTGLVATVH